MKLKYKIQPKYLEAILNDEERFEFRQFDSIELEEIGTGRVVEFEINGRIDSPGCTFELIKEKYPDVRWRDVNKFPIYRIPLGKKIAESQRPQKDPERYSYDEGG